MNAPANRYSLEFIQSMLTEKSGRVSGWFKELELRSVYQPIYSLTHKRVIGFDASLRGSDPGGKPVSAGSLFGPVENYSETCLLDLLCTTIHLHNFFSEQPPRSLLFIKLHPEVLLDAEPTAEFLASLCRHYSVPEHRLVIDVPGSILHEANAAAASEAYRRAGCLIAINNFGVDNSNLDTISEIEPTAVRMARAVVADAARDYRAQQMLRRALSMLHEAGKLIEMEGVESEREALAAIDADADLASGYFFGRHCEDPRQFEANGAMERLWSTYKGRHADNTREEVTERASLENELLRSSVKGKLGAASPANISRYREERRPFLVALQSLTAQLQSGTDFESACADFLALPGAIRCYMLDGEGTQIGIDVMSAHPPARQGLDLNALVSTLTADWSRRDFFLRARREPGVVQASRPYCSASGYTRCVTFSVAIELNRETAVICGDVDWSLHA